MFYALIFPCLKQCKIIHTKLTTTYLLAEQNLIEWIKIWNKISKKYLLRKVLSCNWLSFGISWETLIEVVVWRLRSKHGYHGSHDTKSVGGKSL